MTSTPAYLSALLHHDDGLERLFCPEFRRDKWGHVAASCSWGLGHLGDLHADVHSGHTWRTR